MAIVEEVQIQTVEGNEIYQISTAYIQRTIKVYTKIGSDWVPTVKFTDLGSGYIQMTPAPAVNTEIKFEFQTLDENQNLTAKVLKLEKEVDSLQKQVGILTEALEERVNKHTFNVWIKAVETSLGLKILGTDLLGIEGKNSYK